MKNLNVKRINFMMHIFSLFLSIKGKLNFMQFERFGMFDEQTFRNQFEENFDFLAFNKILVKAHCGKDLALAFDPSYISKSGKKTPGVGYFWSGCAGRAKWGLEISGMAVIDSENHTAFHLEAVQTIDLLENETLLDWYKRVVLERKKDFHFNTSLTTINLAKISHWLSEPKEKRGPFSMLDIKTVYHNDLQINRFVCKFGINPNTKKNKHRIRQLSCFGKIAA